MVFVRGLLIYFTPPSPLNESPPALPFFQYMLTLRASGLVASSEAFTASSDVPHECRQLYLISEGRFFLICHRRLVILSWQASFVPSPVAFLPILTFTRYRNTSSLLPPSVSLTPLSSPLLLHRVFRQRTFLWPDFPRLGPFRSFSIPFFVI